MSSSWHKANLPCTDGRVTATAAIVSITIVKPTSLRTINTQVYIVASIPRSITSASVMLVHGDLNELRSSRKWKGANVWQGIAAVGKLPSPEKFCNKQNLATCRVKPELEKFAH
jgi:hypothetical protein